MENQEWYPFYFNGKETDIEVTKDGRARRVYKDWKIYPNDKIRNLVGEIDFNKRTLARGYVYVSFSVKDEQSRSRGLHQVLASVFLGHTINKFDKIIDHIDNNPLNNNINNLQIVTPRFNIIKDMKNRCLNIEKEDRFYVLKYKCFDCEYKFAFLNNEDAELMKNTILSIDANKDESNDIIESKIQELWIRNAYNLVGDNFRYKPTKKTKKILEFIESKKIKNIESMNEFISNNNLKSFCENYKSLDKLDKYIVHDALKRLISLLDKL